MEQHESFARFVDEQHAQLVRTLTLYTGDVQLGADLAADALVQAAQHWPRVVAMSSPGGWVHRVGINTANSWLRRRRAARAVARRRGVGDLPRPPRPSVGAHPTGD